MTVPLTKVSNHILVLQTQIVLDRQTDRRFLREKPMFLGAKGTTKKADAFDFFCLSQLKWCWQGAVAAQQKGNAKGNIHMNHQGSYSCTE